MAETLLEMAERLRQVEDLVAQQRALVAEFELDGRADALRAARALLHFLEASRDAHATLLARERARLGET